MGTLYLIDGHNAVLANSEINDTIPLEAGESQLINGSFVVRVPFGIPIDGTPEDLAELETQKFTGLLAFFPGFTYIDYDDGLDATGWDTSPGTSYAVRLGSRMCNSIDAYGTLQSNAVTLSGSAPSSAIITWEVFSLTRAGSTDDPKDGTFERRYTEEDASNFLCSVSFDNGAHWYQVTDGVLLSIPLVAQGTDFLISFSTVPASRFWIGSWAVLY